MERITKRSKTAAYLLAAMLLLAAAGCAPADTAQDTPGTVQDTGWPAADINRDGRTETFSLDKTKMDSEGCVTLRVLDEDGKELWNEQMCKAHAGWDSLFLCELDGEPYLLRYQPSMYQGDCAYTYTLFTLEGGSEKVVRSNGINFDINGTKALDADKMVAFADEVNALLEKSTLLLSSEGGTFSFGPASAAQFYERYAWLDETPQLYAQGDDLKTRLEKYSAYAMQQWNP